MDNKKERTVIYGFQKEIHDHIFFNSKLEAKSFIDGFEVGTEMFSGDEAWATIGDSIDLWDGKLNKKVEEYLEKII